MTVPPTLYPTNEQTEKKALRNKRFRESLKRIISIFNESFIDGHQGTRKLACYVWVQKELPGFDKALLEVFIELTNSKR